MDETNIKIWWKNNKTVIFLAIAVFSLVALYITKLRYNVLVNDYIEMSQALKNCTQAIWLN